MSRAGCDRWRHYRHISFIVHMGGAKKVRRCVQRDLLSFYLYAEKVPAINERKMLLEITAITIGVIFTVLYINTPGNKCKPPKNFSERLKTWIVFAYLKWIHPKKQRLGVGDIYGKLPTEIGVLPNDIEESCERPQQFTNGLDTIDSVHFTGHDRFGNKLLVQLARKQHGVTEVKIYLKTSSGEEYQNPCHPNALVINTATADGFSAGGLTLEVLIPMRKWRISFNGFLRKGILHEPSNDIENTVHVKFNLLWVPMLRTYDFNFDYNNNLLASSIAKEMWNYELLRQLKGNHFDGYDHWGQIFGTVSVGREPEQEIFLRGVRRRRVEQSWRKCEKLLDIQILTTDGCVLCFNFAKQQHGRWSRVNAYLIWSSNYLLEIDGVEQDIDDLLVPNEVPTKFTVRFHIMGGHTHAVHITIESTGMVNFGENGDTKITMRTITANYGERVGFGFMEIAENCSGKISILARKPVTMLRESHFRLNDNTSNVVKFSDPKCHSSVVVGGKGMSLGLLNKMETNDFVVPAGICVTISAYWKHLKNHPALQDAIRKLEDVAWSMPEAALQTECERTVKLASETEISIEIQQDVLCGLERLFGGGFVTRKFAVRSSAIGEDSELASAAGQNATFLGVIGRKNMWKAIASCWASQFTVVAVEYKKQLGQLINAGMAVVIQEMVPADSGGVLFTRDPVTGSPENMTIAANYGLGESVVSASADPDTITVSRSWDNNLVIKEKLIGKKNIKIVMKGEGGIEEQGNAEDTKLECCLSEEDIYKIGQIGVQLENAFGAPRDIEWAISNGIIHVLQARPISNLNSWTDFEITHDQDTAFLTDAEITTRANLGEVLPGAMTQLSRGLVNDSYSLINTRFFKKMIPGLQHEPYFPAVIKFFQSNAFLNFSDLMAGNVSKDGCNSFGKAHQFAIFGRQVSHHGLEKQVLDKFGEPQLKQTIHITKGMTMLLFQAKGKLQEYSSYKQFRLNIENVDNSMELFNILMKEYNGLIDGCTPHLYSTMGNSFCNAVLISILSNSSESPLDMYTDIATLLACCDDVESANVPEAIKQISIVISKDPDSSNFTKMTPQLALDWLKSHPGEVGIQFSNFLDRHGHRCVKECDLSSATWGDDPITVITILQQILSHATVSHTNTKVYLSPSEAVGQLKTRLPLIKRLIIKAFLPTCRKFVGYREQSKSLYMGVINQYRQALNKMKMLMVHEGRLPEPDLIYFLSVYELGEILRTRSPHLVTLASRRMKVFPTLNLLQFPELIVGFPKPLTDERDTNPNMPVDFVLTGIPACRGIVKGSARVVRQLKDAVHIKKGDILVTFCTDIGWSPYFPLLAGLVTEIGGLISHGAVIAREYGLPCIIAVEGATSRFSSGDIIMLNATTGTVSKVPDN